MKKEFDDEDANHSKIDAETYSMVEFMLNKAMFTKMSKEFVSSWIKENEPNWNQEVVFITIRKWINLGFWRVCRICTQISYN